MSRAYDNRFSDPALSALRAAEEKFRTLVEHALVGVYILQGGRHVYCNPAMLQMLGYDLATLQSFPVLDLVVEEDRERVEKLIASRGTAPGASLRYSARVRRGDGRIIDMDVHGTVIEYEGGPAVIGTAMDVTEQRRDAEALQRSEARYRTLVEEAQDIIFTCDASGRITSLNRAFEEITGWKCEEWIGRHFTEIVEPESADAVVEHFEDVKKEKAGSLRESRLRTASGKSILVQGTARPLYVDGELAGTIGITRDITERRRLEAALERSGRLTSLGRVAATLAHEFNNVLMSIQATTDLLLRSPDAAAVGRSALSLRSAVQRGRRVTQEVLRFANMPEPELEVLNLRALLENMRHELEALTGPAVRLETRFHAPADLAVTGDRSQLQQVVMNLVVNARDAMPGGGTIIVSVAERPSAAPDESAAVLTVSDSGIGIPADRLSLVFEPLFTTKKSGGTGLGLTVVAQIVDRHRGTVEIRSAEGKGTEVEIVLPAIQAAETAAVVAPREHSSVQRVLIVDDDESITAGLSAILELEGVTTECVSRGADAEAAVLRFSPQVVVLDLNLPDMPGIELHPILTARWPDLPIIISSGRADEPLIQLLVRSRRCTFLLKPYELETLMRAIEEVTGL